MHSIRRLVITFILFIALQAFADEPFNISDPGSVIFLSTNQFPLENTDFISEMGVSVAVYNLDAQINLEQSLTANLPENIDIATAESLVQERIDNLSQEKILSIFKAPAVATKWNIEKAPAWIFNQGEAVIYGVTDAREAFEIWNDWRANNGK